MKSFLGNFYRHLAIFGDTQNQSHGWLNQALVGLKRYCSSNTCTLVAIYVTHLVKGRDAKASHGVDSCSVIATYLMMLEGSYAKYSSPKICVLRSFLLLYVPRYLLHLTISLCVSSRKEELSRNLVGHCGMKVVWCGRFNG